MLYVLLIRTNVGKTTDMSTVTPKQMKQTVAVIMRLVSDEDNGISSHDAIVAFGS